MMKQKIELIDFNLISTYFGKYLTVFVTLVVFAITAGALLSNESGVGGVLKIAVSMGDASEDLLERFEPFGTLLSSHVRRAVEIVPYSEDERDIDLYIMSLDRFLDARRDLHLVPLRSLVDYVANEDIAVVITAASNESIEYNLLTISDVAFTDSISPNGFWLPLEDLEKRGFQLPERLDRLRFEGSDNHSCRIVLGVQWNRYTLGACCMSDLIHLEQHGLLARDEIRIVSQMDALPEVLFAAPQAKAAHLEDALAHVDDVLLSRDAPRGLRAAVAEMQAAGFRRLLPVDDGQIRRAEKLARYVSARF
jgi:ABC-type phosphate/phosphonate transport system substrate-binding protein